MTSNSRHETLVLLPGMMCDERLFAPLIARLHQMHDIFVAPLTDGRSIENLAAGILAWMPAGPLNIAGLSMGGIVAMEMARQAPDRVLRLALLDTNHRADTPERQQLRDRQVAEVKAGGLRKVIVEEMKPRYLAARHRGDQALLDLLVDMAMSLGSDVFISQSEALRDRRDQTDTLRVYRGPTLLLCGAEDDLCPPDRHREMAALCARGELTIVPDAGHISPLEQPDAVASALRDWLSRNRHESGT